MKYISLLTIMLTSVLFATSEVSTLAEVFSEADVSGNVKYYYIQTDKDNKSGTDTSAYANSLGGKLQFNTASLYGFHAGVTFMTTNPFFLGPNVDASIIGRDNGVRLGEGPSGEIASRGFSVLGEAYLAYDYKDINIYFGREVIKTPLIDAKVVRLLPSAVEGISLKYALKGSTKFDLAYYSSFKQRTSDVFINIIKHALGDSTREIIGSDSGYVGMFGFNHEADVYTLKLYNYYASNFMNSIYMSGEYKTDISEVKVTFGAEYIGQKSIGNAQINLAKVGSDTGGKSIAVNAFGLKVTSTFKSTKLILAYSKVLRDKNKHDSLVLPWDGTPLFTNMITSNDLFQSNYANALNADSIYIGGAQGIKLLYNQKYDSFGLKGFSTTLAYLNTRFNRQGFDKTQEDSNIVFQYKTPKAFTLQLKGIWVKNDTSANKDGTLKNQLQLLTQYRIIANYKF
ncbi:hypothetical protein JHD46_01675 [Sulfurimonas sp. SAG-AH-194-C20]|nr:hypothetical protein [Sulfurimonas sp. SAG-AH-194-C20]MDF1878343.1 hypothetical protein [Sulfurimonas sp. SAG-AH-194-C20]